jgi:peptidoglycan/LPS O-acetylase OafA/YrhL
MDTNLATKRERFHLLLLLLTNVTISVLLIAKYRSGEINRTNAILSAAFCMVFLNAVMLVAFWKSAAKTGDTLSAKLWVAAAAFALCGFSITSLVVAQSPHHDRDVELALSDTPLSSIQP